MESSLSSHWYGANHGVSDGKVSEWNWHRGLIRARVNNKEIISVSTCVCTLFSSEVYLIYIYTLFF